MSVSLLIHTEDSVKLNHLFKKAKVDFKHLPLELMLHSKGYKSWEDNNIYSMITSFNKYYAFPTDSMAIESLVDLIIKAKTRDIIIADEDNLVFTAFKKNELLKINLDTKYKTLKWFLIDIKTQLKQDLHIEADSSTDYQRYLAKRNSTLFSERIIYIDGGLGDHIMAMPLIAKLSEHVYICCKYPFVYDAINVKGIIDWDDELFGAYTRFVYSWGSNHESSTIIDAFFEMYGEAREESDILTYKGHREKFTNIAEHKKVLLICTSAAKINNNFSNKDWRDIRWMKLIHELKKLNYYVIQVGGSADNQIPNVDYKFLDKPIAELAGIIEISSLWISVDTFFHHFAAAIKPEAGICLTPFYNDHAKHPGVKYIEKDCGKNFSDRRWWLDSQQPERKDCMDLIMIEDVLNEIN